MDQLKLKDMTIGRQGFGCMGLSAFYESAAVVTVDSAVEVFKTAVDNGVTLFNTADFYGPLNAEGYGANLRLLKHCLAAVGREKVQIMCKIGVDTREGTFQHNASPEALRKTVDWALEQLGTDYLDILVLNREDPVVPLKDSVEALHQLVKEGKGRHIGLSEFSASNIRAAAAVAPIACVEMEWSLMSRDLEERIVPTCRELGIAIVAYSPLCRGLLSGAFREPPKDWRGTGMPRFAPEHLPQNLALVDALNRIAERKGCTPSQLSLAWVHAQGDDVFPIPGTTKLENLRSNLEASRIKLSAEELAEIEAACPASGVQGTRYAHMAMTFHGNKDQ